MVDETLVEALERAGVPLHKSVFVSGLNLPTRITVALDDASTLLPILVAHATPEARAALLRTLLGERLEKMADPEGDLMVSGWREDGERGSVWVTVPFLRDSLAPEVTP